MTDQTRQRLTFVLLLILSALTTLTVISPSQAATWEVREGESIQAAVKQAADGDTILVYPGVYSETVYVDKDDITLKGVVVEGEWPNLDGDHHLNDAILYSGNGFSVEWFKITHFKGNAIMGQAGNNFSIRNNWIVDTGVYGIFPEFGENGLIENNVVSGIEDAAIYVGMSDHIDVRNNHVFDNVAGIEIENSRHALVEGNIAQNNTGGILVFITPGLPIKTSYDAIIRRNTVIDNNTPNFGIPGSLVSTIPAGTGMIVLAGDDVIIEDNIISGNNTAGIIVTSQDFATDVAGDPESDPNPDRVQIRDNVMFNNGNDRSWTLKRSCSPSFLHKDRIFWPTRVLPSPSDKVVLAVATPTAPLAWAIGRTVTAPLCGPPTPWPVAKRPLAPAGISSPRCCPNPRHLG